MLYADFNGLRIKANKENRNAICPICGKEVISKCGELKIWHWAHKSINECDSWHNGETDWHLEWKELYPENEREIVIKKDGKIHRADILRKNIWYDNEFKDVVIEFQNSPISFEEIKEREEFYGNMVWVLNGNTLVNMVLTKFYDGGVNFKWKYFNPRWLAITKPLFIDFGYDRDTDFILIKNLYENGYGSAKVFNHPFSFKNN